MKTLKAEAVKDLQTIPGIGKSLSDDLWNLGIHKVSELAGKNPAALYNKLNKITGTRQDPCVLYTFRCAVYFASEKRLEAKKLKWWYWKDKSYNEK
jgi:hypothetical protein